MQDLRSRLWLVPVLPFLKRMIIQSEKNQALSYSRKVKRFLPQYRLGKHVEQNSLQSSIPRQWHLWRLFDKSFENTMGKGEIARNEQFLLFPQCLPIHLDNFLLFPIHLDNFMPLNLSSANSFILEDSKMCRLVLGWSQKLVETVRTCHMTCYHFCGCQVLNLYGLLKIQSTERFCILNTLLNNPGFSLPWNDNFEKHREKILETSIFSFSHIVSYSLRWFKLSCNNSYFVVCRDLKYGRV